MAECIDRAAALEITTRTCGDYAAAWSEIRRLPAVDAVVVTRCKDCAYGDPTWAGYVCNCNEYAALESTLYHEEDFFCAYGEPKEVGTNA